jgi:hypothetical protein
MSAECGDCGTDLGAEYGDGSWPDMFCVACRRNRERERVDGDLKLAVAERDAALDGWQSWQAACLEARAERDAALAQAEKAEAALKREVDAKSSGDFSPYLFDSIQAQLASAQAVIDAALGLVATVDSPDSMHMAIDHEQELYALGIVRAALAAHLEKYPMQSAHEADAVRSCGCGCKMPGCRCCSWRNK